MECWKRQDTAIQNNLLTWSFVVDLCAHHLLLSLSVAMEKLLWLPPYRLHHTKLELTQVSLCSVELQELGSWWVNWGNCLLTWSQRLCGPEEDRACVLCWKTSIIMKCFPLNIFIYMSSLVADWVLQSNNNKACCGVDRNCPAAKLFK